MMKDFTKSTPWTFILIGTWLIVVWLLANVITNTSPITSAKSISTTFQQAFDFKLPAFLK